ncbi:protein jason, partial [Quercus suber]
DSVIFRNCLASLFLSEEKEDSPNADRETHGFGSPESHKALKDEARFLKACGTFVETPAEIWKASANSKNSHLHMMEIQSLQNSIHGFPTHPSRNFTYITLEGSLSAQLKAVEQEVLIQLSELMLIRPKTLQYQFHLGFQPQKFSAGASLHFQCDFDASSSSSENVSQNQKRYESPGNQSVSKPSPYPTSLKLSDEMQTPGTVFPTNIDIFTIRKT